jgi:signal transduction histidine kinase
MTAVDVGGHRRQRRASVAAAGLRGHSIDGVFERLYGRFGARYVDVTKVFIWASICLFVVPGYGLLLLAPWHPSLGEYARSVLAYELVLGLIAGPGTFVIARLTAPATYRWVAGHHAASDAPGAWASTVAGLPRWVGITALWWGACCVPPSLYTAASLDFAWYGYPIYLLSLTGMNLVVGVFFYLFFEQALRPVVREIAAHLPEDCDPPRSVMTLGVKALVLLPAINFFSAVVVGLLATNGPGPRGPELYLGQIVLLAVVVSLTLSLVLTLMFRNSVVRRIADLREAMRSVDRGDLATHVTPLAGDELDDMGESFNEMVAGLRDRAFLRDDNAKLVVDLQHKADELQDSRARLVAASDGARRRVERDLHDGAQQRLVLLRLKLGMARAQVVGDPLAAAVAIDELRDDLDCALSELRDLAHGIYPTILENDGLGAALREAAQRAAIPIQVRCDGGGRYSPDLEAAVYFCCLEALQNAAKHAGSGARAEIKLEHRDDVLAFEVSDDGQGFDVCTASASSGVQNMTDRIGALGGTLLVESAPKAGTTITGAIPAPRVGDSEGEALRALPEGAIPR